MLVKSTIGSMHGTCTSIGIITDVKRHEIEGKLGRSASLLPSAKIRVFERCTGYRVHYNHELLKQNEYHTRIIISDGVNDAPVKQKQFKSIW